MVLHATHRRRSRNWLLVERLESRFCLSAIGFATHDIVSNQLIDVSSILAADLDGDDDVDLVTASNGDNKIAWLENVDGRGSFGPQRVISTKAGDASECFLISPNCSALHAADVDGDGDTDVFSAMDKTIAWYENADGQGNFGDQQIVTTQVIRAQSVFAADLDGDGDLDALSASWDSLDTKLFNGKIAWYENIDGQGTFGPQLVISMQVDSAESVRAADIDGDGDIDVFSASLGEYHPELGFADGAIAWYENMDGRGTFGPPQVIDNEANGGFHSLHVADMDGDGDSDAVSVSSSGYRNTIAWHENTDGQGSFGERKVIADDVDGSSLFIEDLDDDGDRDILAANSWYENKDGKGVFGSEQLIPNSSFARSVHAADVDGDGDADVVSASFDDSIAWQENTDGRGTFEVRHTVLATFVLHPESVHAADLDGDGDTDMLSASISDGKVAWYENVDGQGAFGPQRLVTDQAGGPRNVYATDIDDDGDVDVLSADWFASEIAWYENSDGRGNFGARQVITGQTRGAMAVFAADLDGDGDADVLSASWYDDEIAWYENSDGQGTFGPQQVISTNSRNAADVYAADLDGDGDNDIVAAASTPGKAVAWYENTDGKGTFGPAKAVTTSEFGGADSVHVADIDGDGDLDVVSSYLLDVVWHENIDGRGVFGTPQLIALHATSVYTADVDGDGDTDVLSASFLQDKIAWHENVNGQGIFESDHVITTHAAQAQSVFATDLDGDGDIDVLSASSEDSKIAWYENRLIGDANDDGMFNSSDLVSVFQAGEYEDDVPSNSTYDEGDWNADDDFTSLDLVVAFQAGTYADSARNALPNLLADADLVHAAVHEGRWNINITPRTTSEDDGQHQTTPGEPVDLVLSQNRLVHKYRTASVLRTSIEAHRYFKLFRGAKKYDGVSEKGAWIDQLSSGHWIRHARHGLNPVDDANAARGAIIDLVKGT